MVKLFFILLTMFPLHPVHVSMSSLYGNSDEGNLKLSVRMYSDDLALDLYRLYDAEGTYSELDHIFTFTGSDSYYERYINDHLKIYSDGIPLLIKLEKKEILDLETLLSFSVELEGNLGKGLKVENRILTSLYSDQVNLFIIRVDGYEKGVKFTTSKTGEVFKGD